MSTLDEMIAEQVKRYKERQAAEAVSEKPARPELPSTPEAAELPEAKFESAPSEPVVPPAPVAAPAPAPVPAPKKDRLLQDIESAMQADLEALYKQLPPARQKLFRSRGEQVAFAIRGLLASAKANVKKIFHLLFDWLKLLSGVNRFYLEQEAKIKTDKILMAAEEERQRASRV